MKTVAIWLLVIFLLSIIPTKTASESQYADKVLHFFLYAITCALFFSILIRGRTFRRAIVLSVLLSAGYGALMEVVQIYFPTRSFSVSDIAVNTLGALATAVYLMVKTGRRR